MLKKIQLCLALSLFLSSSLASAQEINEATKEVANQVIVDVYRSILAVKDKFPELAAFDEKVLYENKYGIYTISYQYTDPRIPNATDSYEFLITIIGMNDEPFKRPGFEDFQYGFPILDLRAVVFIKKDTRWQRFKLENLIPKNLDRLSNYQQEFLPLRIFLTTNKDVYKVNERIQFNVKVINQSRQNLRVKPLDGKSLYFTFDDKNWGSIPTSQQATKEVILPPGGSLSRDFKGESFSKPKEIEIVATYNVGYRGILPSSLKRIRIVP